MELTVESEMASTKVATIFKRLHKYFRSEQLEVAGGKGNFVVLLQSTSTNHNPNNYHSQTCLVNMRG